MQKYHLLYKTTCLITGNYYVGMHSTDDLNDLYLGSGIRILNSIRKYGKKNHVREIIELLDTREELRELERKIVDQKMLEDEKCMNLDRGGQTHDFKNLGTTREKMRLAKLGKKQSLEWIVARSIGLKGHTVSKETREKISRKLQGHKSGMTGHKHSEETRKKMSESQKRRFT